MLCTPSRSHFYENNNKAFTSHSGRCWLLSPGLPTPTPPNSAPPQTQSHAHLPNQQRAGKWEFWDKERILGSRQDPCVCTSHKLSLSLGLQQHEFTKGLMNQKPSG